MSQNKPTYEELLSKLAETEGVLTRLSEKLEAVVSQRDSALLGSRELEESYIESEQNFRNSMDACPLGVRIVTEDGELIYANQAILDICGYGSVEELKAVPRKQLYTPESYAAHQERKEKRNRGEYVPPEYEINIRRPDGEVRNLQVFRKEVTWGGERQFMTMYQDVTERKKAEEDLRRSEENYRSVVELIPDGILTIDRSGVITSVNKAVFEITGFSEKELVGKHISKVPVLSFKNVPQALNVFNNIIRGKGPIRVEMPCVKKDGTPRIGEFRVSLMKTAGKTTGIQVIARDVTERKKAEEELKAISSRQEAILAAIPDIIIEVDNHKIYTWANKAGVKFFGDDVIGKEAAFYFEGEQATYDTVKPLFNGDESVIYLESWQRRRDGEKRLLAWWCRALKDKNGNVTGALSTARDITERKQAEERMAYLASYPEVNPNPIMELDLQGNIRYINPATTKEFPDLARLGIKHPFLANWTQVIKEIQEVKSGNTVTREVAVNGSVYEQQMFAVAKNQIRIYGNNITERKESEERIRHLNLTLHSIRNVNQLITREKDRGRLLQGVCNNLVESRSFGSAWIVLLDESRKPLAWAATSAGSNFSVLIDSFKQGNLPHCVQKAIKQKQAVVTEDPSTMCPGCPLLGDVADFGSMTIRLEIKGNIYGILCASISKILLSDKNEVALFQEVATDIAFALHDMELGATNELLEQERLRAAKLESIGTLAGGIAHDFNNLLTGIMGNIGLVKTYIAPSDATFEMLDEAEKAAVRASDLTQQLLTFARGGKPVKKPVNIAGLIKESAVFALRGSNVRLELSLPDDLWSVEADEGQISQVINNLVINADEAMPSGGILRIESGNLTLKRASGLPLPSGNYVHIDIKDTGIGISKEHLERIFEPYFTTKQKGSGLGLTTAYSIVKNHGGYILAESKQNEGSAFHIYLPTSKKTVKKGRKVANVNSGQAGGKVLVMDDEEIIRKMLKNMLSLAGYEVEVSADGKEALEKYTQAMQALDPFDAVIMDLTIPGGMGGKEAIKKLLEIDANATVIVSSGYATDAIMSEYKKYGFKAVIAKPYSVKQLQETLSGLSRKKRKAPQ